MYYIDLSGDFTEYGDFTMEVPEQTTETDTLLWKFLRSLGLLSNETRELM